MSSLILPYDIDQEIKRRGRKDIVSRECKHATYSVGATGRHDVLTVKEWVTYKDGTRLPTVRIVEDYKRPAWVTKEPYRTHPDKIQFESLNRLDRFTCRQMDLQRELYNRIRYGSPDWPVRRLARKPYIYGCDFGSEVYLKNQYMEQYPGAFKPNKVTVFDVETNVWDEGFKPILWSEVNDDEIILYYNRSWTKDHPNYEEDVLAEYIATIPQYMDQIRKKLSNRDGSYPDWIDRVQNLPVRFVPGEDDVDITQQCTAHLHLTQPDIVTGWNVFFDTNVIHETAMRGGILPETWMCDPRVPDEYKLAYIREGPSRKVTASGRDMMLAPQERWHVTLHSASFRIADSMQLYWQLRKAKGKENGGYGLDAVMTRQIGVGKVQLSVEDSDVPAGTIHWHMEMQRKYKVPYGVYSIFDSVGLKCMEYKNNDLSSQISSLAGALDYSQFNSQPKINAVDMHFYALKHRDRAIATTSDQMETELDQSVIERLGWIITFPSHQVRDIGLCLFEDMPDIRSTVYKFGADADVETTYPTAEIIMNLGKEQTEAEPCYIPGVKAESQRRQSINITGGRVNAIEILQEINGLASLDAWVEHMDTTYYKGDSIKMTIMDDDETLLE